MVSIVTSGATCNLPILIQEVLFVHLFDSLVLVRGFMVLFFVACILENNFVSYSKLVGVSISKTPSFVC